MAERFKAHAWNACIGETLSWVRIPLSPPKHIYMGIKKILTSIKHRVRSFTETPLQNLHDQIADKPPNQKITPIVHQTWFQNKFGKTHLNSLKAFRSLNKNLNFKIYSDKEVGQYMEKYWSNSEIFSIFHNCIIGPLKSDIFRYCILFDQGGYYFDISRGCKIPLTNLHDKDDHMVLTYEDTDCFLPPENHSIYDLKRPFNHMLQWGLAFESKHIFLKLLIDEIISIYPNFKNKIFENPKLAILNFTGPGMYTYVMRKYISTYGMKGISELDIKFNNEGIFKLEGSQFRYQQKQSYTYLKDKKICN